MDPPVALVRQALSEGIRAVRLFPRLHRFSLAEWSADELFAEVEQHRIPVLLDFGRTHWAEDVVDYGQVARICATFPGLPLVLTREGIGSVRHLYPLLERFPNLHLDISYYQASGGLADIARRFGARRLLFGTGLPEYSGGPAIAMVCYADLSEEDKRRIAGDNLRNLLSGVK
jgi:predicted TIM-barrel fold metal-dependent hydrolase